MGSYDQLNKQKEKYEKLLSEKEKQCEELIAKNNKLKEENDALRKHIYDIGEGKGEVNKKKKELNQLYIENKTLENKLKVASGEKLIATFTEERQLLIKKIRCLSFSNQIFNSLVTKFKNGLDDVIEIAYRIKNNHVDDMDYYTFTFRDNIVGLLEKMLYIVTNKKEDSASRYLVNIINKNYSIDKDYLTHVPNLNNDEVLKNILDLINLQTTAYHGSGRNQRNKVYNSNTGEVEKSNKFLNLHKDKQLTAIFTLLEFMYYFFSCKDSEENLMLLSSNWLKTI